MIDSVLSLHHVTWVVADLEAAIAALAPLAGAVVREPLPQRGVVTARVRFGEAWLVLVQPLGPGAPAERLAHSGEGPMLLSFRVASLETAL
jgi:hypothetical protein